MTEAGSIFVNVSSSTLWEKITVWPTIFLIGVGCMVGLIWSPLRLGFEIGLESGDKRVRAKGEEPR
jgi:hypothetical protein